LIPSRLFAALSRAALRPTATQLTAAMGVLAALALTGSLVVTGLAVQTDQREKAALIALQDFAAMAAKLGADDSFSTQTLTDTDAAWLAAWLEAVQTRPGDARSLEAVCRTGRGGATGTAYTFVAPDDAENIDNIEKLTGQRIDRLELPPVAEEERPGRRRRERTPREDAQEVEATPLSEAEAEARPARAPRARREEPRVEEPRAEESHGGDRRRDRRRSNAAETTDDGG